MGVRVTKEIYSTNNDQFLVTVPKDFVEEHGLEEGDEVEIWMPHRAMKKFAIDAKIDRKLDELKEEMAQ